MRITSRIGVAWAALLLGMLTACAPMQTVQDPDAASGSGRIVGAMGDSGSEGTAVPASPEAAAETASDAEPRSEVFPGTGRVVRPAKAEPGENGSGDITLNFEDTDIRKVVDEILGKLLGVNYVIDPKVKGMATLQTGRPLREEDLLPTLETLLRMNGAALVDADGVYKVLPAADAVRGKTTPQLGGSVGALPSGYRVQVVPLKYVGVTEMAEILKPLAPEGSIIRTDKLRNLLVLAGTGPEMRHLLDTVHIFDVNWLEGMSVGFFTLENIDLEDLMGDLKPLLGAELGALDGALRVVPVERANGVLVVSPQAEYIETVGQWIRRLDRLGGGNTRRLFVYPVQNGKAENLASLLSQLFAAEQKAGTVDTPDLAPNRTPTRLTSGETTDSDGGQNKQPAAASSGGGSSRARQQVSTVLSGSDKSFGRNEIRVVADTENNALLIMATPQDYERITDALKRLDKTPLQVLVEATIAEVRLTGELQYGLQWFFKTHHGDKTGNWTLDNSLDSSESSGLGNLFPGFNYTLVDSLDQVRAVLSALASRSKLKVLSSPSVMVLDNRTANIRVGDQVPIVTQQQQSTTTANSNIVNSVEYRDTGVLLSVTPRVNPGGLVIMDIEQEVSDVAPTTTSGLDSPTIQQRRIASSVAVHSGQTVVLGGLMRENISNARAGVPGLQDMPVVGNLFGQKDNSSRRTELVVLLTPKVIAGDTDVRAVTEEFRNKLQRLEETLGFPERKETGKVEGGAVSMNEGN